MFSLLIRNGTVCDGDGTPPFKADIAVGGDCIEAVGSLGGAAAGVEIDAEGCVVAPGFIDVHSHADLHLLSDGLSLPKLMQGVTTEVVGNCGLSLVPARAADSKALREYLEGVLGNYEVPFIGTSLPEYMDALEEQGTAVNVASLTAHGSLRRKVMGLENAPPSGEHLDAMRAGVEEAMDAGAAGLSTGLAYPPAFYAKTDELTALCKAVARRGGVFSIHIRSEANFLIESIEEALTIARESGVSIEISHLKAYGAHNWHKAEKALMVIEHAREEGVDVSFDSYPYTYGSTILAALLPPGILSDGADLVSLLADSAVRERIKREIMNESPGTENYATALGFDGLWKAILFSGGSSGLNERYEGMPLGDIAEASGESPVDVILKLLQDEGGSAAMLVNGMNQENVDEIARHPLHMWGSDGLYGGKPHPRTYGTFARVLEDFVCRRQVLTLPEAVRHMTSRPAEKFGLKGRGRLSKGYFADIAIFRLDEVRERAAIKEPRLFPEGIEAVIVNGKIAASKGRPTGEKPGRMLRKRG
ncbi:MAG: D-aminoacylase [Candidatus Eremiobacteraeota bacterium]|nr:D-aminoacylase [Candidatus Eremiobacteraeota bacterium]